MKTILIAWGLLVTSVTLLISGTSHPGMLMSTIGFEKDVKPIFQKHCAECHQGSLDYATSYRQRTKIYDKVVKREMPPKYRLQLSDMERRTVKLWLKQGAKK